MGRYSLLQGVNQLVSSMCLIFLETGIYSSYKGNRGIFKLDAMIDICGKLVYIWYFFEIIRELFPI